VRVLRVYHAGRDRQHRARDRALLAIGVDVVLVVPTSWPDHGSEEVLSSEPFPVIELPVRRAGDVNRHAYQRSRIERVLAATAPDLLDVHAEPFSIAARQWLAAAPAELPVVMYTAQNIDKRFPPPFAQYERSALRRASGLYPCSRQAASVARGKGFAGVIDVIPLGYDEHVYSPGAQAPGVPTPGEAEIVLGLVGRLVPWKGVLDAVRVLGAVCRSRPARLLIFGSGPEEPAARRLAADLGLSGRVEIRPWASGPELADAYRRFQVLLVPSLATPTWVEQFGRVIVEAQACGAVVAGYATGAIPEVAGEGAILVPPRRSDLLGESVLATLEDPADLERRRRLGLHNVAGCTWEQVASSQASLYDRVLAPGQRQVLLPSRPSERRSLAVAELGPPAMTPVGARPFALPLLRSGGQASRALEAALDMTGEVWGSLGAVRSRGG